MTTQTTNETIPTITINVRRKAQLFNLDNRMTTQEMRAQGLVRAANDFEARGIGALLTVSKPRGTRYYDAYETLTGQAFL
jgi:hypothetical protein